MKTKLRATIKEWWAVILLGMLVVWLGFWFVSTLDAQFAAKAECYRLGWTEFDLISGEVFCKKTLHGTEYVKPLSEIGK